MTRAVLVLSFGVLCTCVASSSHDAPVSRTDVSESTRQEMQGGVLLSGNEILRSGVVTLAGCTGTVIYSSGFYGRAWVLTAAHCVCNFVGSPIGVRATRPDASSIIATGGVAFVPPGYPTGTSSACLNGTHPNDIALVRFPQAIPIVASDGSLLLEHRRAVWSVSPPVPAGAQNLFYRAHAVLGAGDIDGFPKPIGTTGAACAGNDDLTLRWARSWFGPHSTDYNDVPQLEPLIPSGTWIRKGDSGGPWLTTPGPANPSLSATIEHGAVFAVTSTASCWGIQTAWAAATFTQVSSAFLSSTMGSDLLSVSSDWTRACDTDWCSYSDEQRAAVLAPVL